jgi:hypothetical protein
MLGQLRADDRSPRRAEDDYNQLIDPMVTNQMDMMRAYMDNSESNYRTLRLYEVILRISLLSGDPRLQYFDSLGPSRAAKEMHSPSTSEKNWSLQRQRFCRHRM